MALYCNMIHGYHNDCLRLPIIPWRGAEQSVLQKRFERSVIGSEYVKVKICYLGGSVCTQVTCRHDARLPDSLHIYSFTNIQSGNQLQC
jgi:hypothetical protein